MFNVIIVEFVEQEQEQAFTSVIKPEDSDAKCEVLRCRLPCIGGNTTDEDRQRENYDFVKKPAPFVADVGFQYEMLINVDTLQNIMSVLFSF